MADTPVINFAGTHVWIAKGVMRSKYETVTGVTTCLPLTAPQLPDKTFSATGTWGTATLVVEGSNDGTTYLTINCLTAAGEVTAASFTADTIVTLVENPLYIRPKTTGGTGTDLDIYFVSQSTRR